MLFQSIISLSPSAIAANRNIVMATRIIANEKKPKKCAA
ncbi:hypothetical protein D1BOALGB6SA_2217 [Olavius sp. associated proteobacterium Delta 1]|nr:hypothetical protein D1BOALGB6SA_2217 [Olavius sp. associated proteobacterium Delta 1]